MCLSGPKDCAESQEIWLWFIGPSQACILVMGGSQQTKTGVERGEQETDTRQWQKTDRHRTKGTTLTELSWSVRVSCGSAIGSILHDRLHLWLGSKDILSFCVNQIAWQARFCCPSLSLTWPRTLISQHSIHPMLTLSLCSSESLSIVFYQAWSTYCCHLEWEYYFLTCYLSDVCGSHSKEIRRRIKVTYFLSLIAPWMYILTVSNEGTKSNGDLCTNAL